jgi:hypothetical protein
MVLFNRRLIEAHVASLGQHILSVPADGWCLVRSVAIVVKRNHYDLLDDALLMLVSKLPGLPIDDATRAAVAHDCNVLLQQGKRHRQMRRHWDSALGDLMPQALADTVERPLHILRIQAADCSIRAVIVTPATCVSNKGEGEGPIILVRSYYELGFDHYEAVQI